MTISILTRASYFNQLTDKISVTKSGDRVALTAMIFDTNEPIIARIAEELAAAAARGVHVYLAVDARIFLTNEKTALPGPLWARKGLPRHLREPFRSYRATFERLVTSGVYYSVINKPTARFSLMQAGRSHIKAAVVNDTVYIGGCNFEKPDDIDGMLTWHDHTTANWLFGHVRKLTEAGQSRLAFNDTDERHQVDACTEILLDAGKPGQSLILTEALQFLDHAKEWIFFTCQYIPHGRIADHLLRAKKRGVNVTIIFNSPSKHASYEALLEYGAKLHERLRLPADYFQGELPKSKPFLHGKILATEQGVMIGSHNYVYTGVRLGTAEMAVLAHNPTLAKRVAESINRQVGRA